MATPTLREFLEQREQDLIQEIGALRHKLVPLEGELADVRSAKSALAKEQSQQQTLSPLAAAALAQPYPASTAIEAGSPYQLLTMKQLVLKALRERFPKGATANELIEFFWNAWGRTDVVRSSLSPQLSRLKDDGKISREGYRWLLVQTEKNEAPTGDQPEGASDKVEGDASTSDSGDVRQKDIFS